MTALDALADGLQDAFCGRDPAAFAAVCTLDVHYEDPLCAHPLGSVSALGEHAQRLWTAFPDVRVETAGPRLQAQSTAAVPVRILGTHRGESEPLSPTGAFIALDAVLWCELDEERGRLRRIRAFFDRWDPAVQLGVLPRSGSVGERALLLVRGFGLRR